MLKFSVQLKSYICRLFWCFFSKRYRLHKNRVVVERFSTCRVHTWCERNTTPTHASLYKTTVLRFVQKLKKKKIIIIIIIKIWFFFFYVLAGHTVQYTDVQSAFFNFGGVHNDAVTRIIFRTLIWGKKISIVLLRFVLWFGLGMRPVHATCTVRLLYYLLLYYYI